MPNHYLNQLWRTVVNYAHANKPKWNFSENTNSIFQQNVFRQCVDLNVLTWTLWDLCLPSLPMKQSGIDVEECWFSKQLRTETSSQSLTNLTLDKMTSISKTTFSDAFSRMKSFCFFIKISPKFVPKCLIDNNWALVQVMAWRWPGNKALSEPMMVSLLMHICITWPQWVKIGFVPLHYDDITVAR